MAAESESESESVSSFVERLMSSRNRDLPLFFPLILGAMGSSDSDDENNQTRERIVLINPFTQAMVIIQSSRRLEDLVRLISEIESGKTGPPPASKASIDAMPTFQISKGEEEDCVICLEGLEIGAEAKEMPCKHRYHSGCIEKWLGLHGSCPVCRYKMPIDEEEVSGKGGSGGDGDGEGETRSQLGAQEGDGNGMS